MFETFLLTVMMFYPSGKYEEEYRPVEVPACVVVDGVRVEDSSCGIRACMRIGRERAAVIWGVMPGMQFGIMCKAVEGSEEAHEGTGAGGGHPALGFH
jgi:hypothetical protein